MPTYERSVHVDAPFERVWEFHSRVSGLEALTPDWLDLRVEAVVGPDGSPVDSSAVLEAGTVVCLSVAPAEIGPRQRWTSRIVEREHTRGAAYFRDEMVEGPFPTWVHTHLFYRDGDGTLLRDVVRYELSGGALGRWLGPLSGLGFEPLFAFRHRRTKAMLEDETHSRAET